MIIIERVLRDCRHAIRLLANTPGFTAATVTMLGLGIGANTAMFTLIKAVPIEPLPYRTPESLVVIWNFEDRRGTTHLSLREIVAYGDDAKSFEEMAGYTETNVNSRAKRILSAFVRGSSRPISSTRLACSRCSDGPSQGRRANRGRLASQSCRKDYGSGDRRRSGPGWALDSGQRPPANGRRNNAGIFSPSARLSRGSAHRGMAPPRIDRANLAPGVIGRNSAWGV